VSKFFTHSIPSTIAATALALFDFVCSANAATSRSMSMNSIICIPGSFKRCFEHIRRFQQCRERRAEPLDLEASEVNDLSQPIIGIPSCSGVNPIIRCEQWPENGNRLLVIFCWVLNLWPIRRECHLRPSSGCRARHPRQHSVPIMTLLFPYRACSKSYHEEIDGKLSRRRQAHPLPPPSCVGTTQKPLSQVYSLQSHDIGAEMHV
jgi:hypothetical protein